MPGAIQGKNVDPGFRMRIGMMQLPRLLFPASAEFRNFALKIQASWPESGQLEATEWNSYLRTTLPALLYLNVIVMDFNRFIKVRQKPVYHNQLFMPAIYCLLCWTEENS